MVKLRRAGWTRRREVGVAVAVVERSGGVVVRPCLAGEVEVRSRLCSPEARLTTGLCQGRGGGSEWVVDVIVVVTRYVIDTVLWFSLWFTFSVLFMIRRLFHIISTNVF